MTFSELGVALREARVAHSLSIDEIADKLKLTSSLVRRLEEGDMAGLPHAVYTRGFIRGYAAIVHVNLEEYQQAIDEAYPLNVPNEHEEKIVLVASARRRSNKPLLLLACMVLGGALLGAYWKFSQPDEIVVPVSNGPVVEQNTAPNAQTPLKSNTTNEQDSHTSFSNSAEKSSDSRILPMEDSTTKEHGEAQSLHATQPSSDVAVTNTKVQDIAKAEPTLPVSEPTSQLDLKPSSKEDVQNGVQSDSTPATLDAQKNALATASHQHEMKVTAHADCWMRVVPDGGKAKQMILKKGETMVYHFAKNIEMRFGNGGGVSLSYDGKAMPAPGKLGKPITVVYPLQD